MRAQYVFISNTLLNEWAGQHWTRRVVAIYAVPGCGLAILNGIPLSSDHCQQDDQLVNECHRRVDGAVSAKGVNNGPRP